jgi:hypothetical protein
VTTRTCESQKSVTSKPSKTFFRLSGAPGTPPGDTFEDHQKLCSGHVRDAGLRHRPNKPAALDLFGNRHNPARAPASTDASTLSLTPLDSSIIIRPAVP